MGRSPGEWILSLPGLPQAHPNVGCSPSLKKMHQPSPHSAFSARASKFILSSEPRLRLCTLLGSGQAASLFLHSLRFLHTPFVSQKTPSVGTVGNHPFAWLMMLPDPKPEGEEAAFPSFSPDLSCFCNSKLPFTHATLTFLGYKVEGGVQLF